MAPVIGSTPDGPRPRSRAIRSPGSPDTVIVHLPPRTLASSLLCPECLRSMPAQTQSSTATTCPIHDTCSVALDSFVSQSWSCCSRRPWCIYRIWPVLSTHLVSDSMVATSQHQSDGACHLTACDPALMNGQVQPQRPALHPNCSAEAGPSPHEPSPPLPGPSCRAADAPCRYRAILCAAARLKACVSRRISHLATAVQHENITAVLSQPCGFDHVCHSYIRQSETCV